MCLPLEKYFIYIFICGTFISSQSDVIHKILRIAACQESKQDYLQLSDDVLQRLAHASLL